MIYVKHVTNNFNFYINNHVHAGGCRWLLRPWLLCLVILLTELETLNITLTLEFDIDALDNFKTMPNLKEIRLDVLALTCCPYHMSLKLSTLLLAIFTHCPSLNDLTINVRGYVYDNEEEEEEENENGGGDDNSLLRVRCISFIPSIVFSSSSLAKDWMLPDTFRSLSFLGDVFVTDEFLLKLKARYARFMLCSSFSRSSSSSSSK